MDAEGVEQLLQTLGERAQDHGIASLSEGERTALVPYWASGIIDAGGFLHFLKGSYPLADVARRLRLLGYDVVADACGRVSAALFPDGVERPEEQGARAKAIDWEQFRSEERLLFSITFEDMLRVIGEFVEAHRASFRDLTPHG